RQYVFFANVLPEETGEAAIGSWMSASLQKHALRRGRVGVRAEAHPRQSDLATNILFAHHEVDGLDATPVLHDEVHRSLFRSRPTRARHRTKTLPGQRLQRGVSEADEQDVVRRPHLREVILPGRVAAPHLAGDPRSNLGLS